MLVLDELYQGKKYYRKKITTTVNSLDKGVLISKYLFSIGMNRYEIENELYKKFKLIYLRIVNEVELRKKIKYMIDTAYLNPIEQKSISFNQSELNFIMSMEEENTKIILMTMMCMYKYYAGEFNATQMDIQRVAHIELNSFEFHKLFVEFINKGYFNTYIKLEKKFETRRYNGYFMPSDEILSLTKNGSYVVMIDDFRNLWLRVRQILGYNMNLYTCRDCGCIDIKTSHKKIICKECSADAQKKAEEKWKEKNNWAHPNTKDSKYDYYYPTPSKKKDK